MAEWVRLRVGGRRFETSRATLLQYPQSYFSGLLSTDFAECTRRSIRIDRDPDLFAIVLSFLRSAKLHYAEHLRSAVRAEFEFYGLPFSAACESGQRVALYGRLRGAELFRWAPYNGALESNTEELPELSNVPLDSALTRELYALLSASDVEFAALLELFQRHGFQHYSLSNCYFEQDAGYQRLLFEK